MDSQMSLPRMLLRSVEANASAVAIVDGEQRVTYADLWGRVESVASFMTGLGLNPGDRVALLMDNSADYVVAYYAVQLAGGVVVALNHAAKARDIQNWIRHSGAVFLVADVGHPEYTKVRDVLRSDVRTIGLGNAGLGLSDFCWGDAIAAPGHPVSWGRVHGEGLASIIYTSGTTGNPKGVSLTHDNLRANVNSILDYLSLDSGDSIVNILPFFYSYGNSVLHTHLAAGARIVLEKSMMYPAQVLNRMVEEAVTGFSGVPSTYSILLNRVDLTQFDLSSLRYMTQAGGPMAPADIQKLISYLPSVRFFVMYGQTEASARLSYLPPERLSEKLGSIGVAIPGVTIEIHDASGKPVPANQVGELCAQGDNIMHGYWMSDDMTRQTIRDGWLCTGDLAYRDDDGYLYIVGRASDMIKSGAHRISPKDIEEVALEIDGVAEAVAVGIPDDVLGQIIKLIVVTRAGVCLDAKMIQRYCKENLAAYKVPKLIEFTDSIPRTSSGKVQRFKLQ